MTVLEGSGFESPTYTGATLFGVSLIRRPDMVSVLGAGSVATV